jgi:hypothetical protein
VLARKALEAAVRNEADLLKLLSPHAPMSALRPVHRSSACTRHGGH